MKEGNFSGNERYEGFCIDLLKGIASQIGFQYTIRLVPDNMYGVYDSKFPLSLYFSVSNPFTFMPFLYTFPHTKCKVINVKTLISLSLFAAETKEWNGIGKIYSL